MKQMKTKLKSLVAVAVFMLSVTGAYAQEKITLTTSKKKGEKIKLMISPDGEPDTVWIDLNNNGKKDKGEVYKYPTGDSEYIEYTVDSQTFSINGKLMAFYCKNSQLTALEVKSTTMTELDCSNNQLTSLDLSSCKGLISAYCSNNKLSKLNVANGKNKDFGGYSFGGEDVAAFDATKNPNLKCIQVDKGFTPPSPTAKKGKAWKKDATAKYDANCAGAGVVDNVFNASVMLYPNPVNSTLNIKTDNTEIKETAVYNLLGKKLLKTNKPNLDVANLSKGIYLVKIKGTDNKLAVKKFVKN